MTNNSFAKAQDLLGVMTGRLTGRHAKVFVDPDGPIEHFSWAKFVIQGKEHSETAGCGKDIRLIGRIVTEWVERKGHRLDPNMITGVYGLGIEVLVIGTGIDGLIRCSDAVIASIEKNGVKQVILAKTPGACRTYNALYREGKRVAMLSHGAC